MKYSKNGNGKGKGRSKKKRHGAPSPNGRTPKVYEELAQYCRFLGERMAILDSLRPSDRRIIKAMMIHGHPAKAAWELAPDPDKADNYRSYIYRQTPRYYRLVRRLLRETEYGRLFKALASLRLKGLRPVWSQTKIVSEAIKCMLEADFHFSSPRSRSQKKLHDRKNRKT